MQGLRILAALQIEAHSPGFKYGTLSRIFQQRGRISAMWKRDESVKPTTPPAPTPVGGAVGAAGVRTGAGELRAAD